MDTGEDKNGRLAQSIDTVDSLIRAALGDPDLERALTTCRHQLAAISWERFRLRHEELNRRTVSARRIAQFTARHKEHPTHV
jgi:hypothetical protein